MDNYVISDQEEILDAEPPFPIEYTNGIRIMQINKNTKFANIVTLANRMFQDQSVHHLIFRGIGDAADKCISCVEVHYNEGVSQAYLSHLYNSYNIQVRMRKLYFLIVNKFSDNFSMQCSTDKGDFSNQEQTSSEGPKRTPLCKKNHQNKWMRPNKKERIAQHNERDEVLETLDN
uniref:Alba domain-containing protein n=1 Tax=Heterorhabditis bacteriophora TaxID=37862 RepID=A0A1I7XSC1_HETBA